MNEVIADQEKGKKILREKNINFTAFKKNLAEYLHGIAGADEDWLVLVYNSYAGCVGRTGYEPLSEWIPEFFQDYTHKETRIYLKK